MVVSLSLLISHSELFQLWALCEQVVECLAPKEHSIPQKLFFGWVVYWFPTVTKYHKLSGLKFLFYNLLPYNSVDQKSNTRWNQVLVEVHYFL